MNMISSIFWLLIHMGFNFTECHWIRTYLFTSC